MGIRRSKVRWLVDTVRPYRQICNRSSKYRIQSGTVANVQSGFKSSIDSLLSDIGFRWCNIVVDRNEEVVELKICFCTYLASKASGSASSLLG